MTTTASICGEGNPACFSCAAPQACGVIDRMCLPPGAGSVGAACTADGDCRPGTNTGRPFCLTDVTGGVCTDLCSASVTCASGTSCVGFGDFSICLQTCSTLGSFSECGRGSQFSCEFVGSGGVCVPACTSSSQCGTDGRCDAFPGGQRCCGLTGLPCCPTGTACTGLNAFGSRASVCGEGARDYCS
ncbi:MAG: hypothetical protein JRH11_11690 [Deltaproteobacteria bacterium]|nr:hypothetical protein [Deltaproteobacteria bacterium]